LSAIVVAVLAQVLRQDLRLHCRGRGWLHRDEPHDPRVAVQGGQQATVGRAETPKQHPLSFQNDVH
jgi:hypothetical protein